jgi:predicted nucleotidyltransferase
LGIQVEQEDIQALANAIGQAFSPEKIILFGSRAYGEPHEDSDVDLLVILSFTGRPFRKALEILKKVSAFKKFPLDLKVYTPEEIQWRYEGRDPLVREATEKGIVLYEQQKINVTASQSFA